MLMDKFSISESLAWRYTCLLFLMQSRFQLQPTKRRTVVLTLGDLEFFAAVMLQLWVRLSTDPGGPPSPNRRHSGGSAESPQSLKSKLDSGMKIMSAEEIALELKVINSHTVEELKQKLALMQNCVCGVEVDSAMSGHLRDIKSHMLNDRRAFDEFKTKAFVSGFNYIVVR